jgi:hypothetical protein
MSENAAEQDITSRVTVMGRGLKPGIPVVVTAVAVITIRRVQDNHLFLQIKRGRCAGAFFVALI